MARPRIAWDETAKELASVSEQLERVKRRAEDERESLEYALETTRAAAAVAASCHRTRGGGDETRARRR